MTTPSQPAVVVAQRGQFAQPSVAEMVADVIRSQIVDGTLPDGSMLPKQDQLISEFQVSRPSFREALRILESEGLISVRRGNVGGARGACPDPRECARTLGLVLQARNVALDDLAAALAVIEPGVRRTARGGRIGTATVVPQLRELNLRCRAVEPQDLAGAALIFQEFHQAIIDGCGNAHAGDRHRRRSRACGRTHKKAWAAYAEDTGASPEPSLRAQRGRGARGDHRRDRSGRRRRAHQLVVAHLATVSPMVLDHRAPRIDMTGADT